MKQIKQEVIDGMIIKAKPPIAHSNRKYPLNFLDDRIFEVLTYSILKNRLKSKDTTLVKKFDEVVLMQGVGEKGMDCILYKNSQLKGIVQCKKLKSNLNDTIIVKELIKSILNIIVSFDHLMLEKNFTYFIATSTGYTGKALLLPKKLSSGAYFKENSLKHIAQSVIKEYKAFQNLEYEKIEKLLIKYLKAISYEFIRPEEFDLWINSYPEIIETFFEIKKVTDNSLLLAKSDELLNKIDALLPKEKVVAVEEALHNYKKVAAERLNIINFIGFDIQKHRQRPTDITLTELFVQPLFNAKSKPENEKPFELISKQQRKNVNPFKTDKNIVILGDPGSGKSLLIKYLIVNLLQNNSDAIGMKSYKHHLPFRIELRKFNEVKESKSIIDYLSDTLNRDYNVNISTGLLELIIEESNTLLFFDGLDEIFNISHKTKIKELIDSFSTRFKKAKCVVTSRFIGYHDVKFNHNKFDEFAIVKFNDKQINELVVKFFLTQAKSKEKAKINSDNCIKQLSSDVDDELISNPLILTLILILTSNNIVIPDSKLEIYESCTKTLVDSIDTRAKELKFEIPVKNKHLVFSKLAYWQYECQSQNKNITYHKAQTEIANFLLTRKEATDITDAEHRAEKFLEYAERRSIYFENSFTHKTFLEYYTAEYLYSRCIAKASDEGRGYLLDIIDKYLSSSYWYIVFELLFTRVDRVQPDNELLDEIFEKQLSKDSFSIMFFIISNLNKFSNVSKEVKSELIEKTLYLCINGMENAGNESNSYLNRENSIIYKMHSLLGDKENSMLLQDNINYLEAASMSDNQMIDLYTIFFELKSIYKASIKNELKINNIDRVNELSKYSLILFSLFYFKHDQDYQADIRPVDKLLLQAKYFGNNSLFEHVPFKYRRGTLRIDSFSIYLIDILDKGNLNSFKGDIQELLSIGITFDALLSHLKKQRVFYFIRSESIEKILNLYIKSDDKVVDQLLLILLENDKEAYKKIRHKYKHPKLKLIDKHIS